ncbi:shuttling pre-60S factor Ecm1p [Monosporozyma unispora]|nr:60S ribosomal protein subunit export [Kazachstania unispora]
MVRKITKNSRNARQAKGLFDEADAESLNDLPRAEKTDLSNIMIRTAAKNEALLDAKLNKKRGDKKRVGKKSLEERLSKSITQLDKDRLSRALNISNRLDGKISKSIARAKYVQSSRKAGWDTTNNIIKKELDSVNDDDEADKKKKKKSGDDEENMEDDEELEQPYDAEAEETTKEKKDTTPANIFALLENEVEE